MRNNFPKKKQPVASGSKDKALEMLRQLEELVKHWSGEECPAEKGFAE